MTAIEIPPVTKTIFSSSSTTSTTLSTVSTNNRLIDWFRHQTRYAILIISTLCLTLIWSNVLTFNFTVICKDTEDDNNSSNHTSHPLSISDYSDDKTILITVVAASAIAATYPLNVMLSHFGIRRILTAIGCCSAIATGLIPLAASAGLPYLIACRIIQGVAFVGCYTVIGGIVAAWSPIASTGFYISVLSCFKQFSPTITNPIAGALCTSSLGWRAVYYLHTIMSLIAFGLFFVIYRNSPSKHPTVASSELRTINADKIETDKTQRRTVPYAAILRTPAIWAIWLASVGDFFNTNVVLLFSPIFLNQVIKLPVGATGVQSALPPLLQLIVKIGTGYASDRFTGYSSIFKIRFSNTLGLVGTALCFLVLATFFTSPDHPQLALAVLICAEIMLGFDVSGFYKSATLVSRHYSQFVLSIISMNFNLQMLIVPFVVEAVAPDDRPDEWRIIFYIVAVCCFASAAIFIFFSSAQPAAWTMTSDTSTAAIMTTTPSMQTIETIDRM